MKRILIIVIMLAAILVSAVSFAAEEPATNASVTPRTGQFGVDLSTNYLVGTGKAWEAGVEADAFLPIEDLGGLGAQCLVNGKIRDTVVGAQHDFLLLGLGVGYSPKPNTREDSLQPTLALLYGGEEMWVNGVANSVSGPIIRAGLTGYGAAQNRAGGWLAKKMYAFEATAFIPSGEDARISASADWYFRSFNKTGVKFGAIYEIDDPVMGSVYGGNICVTIKFQTAQICAEVRSRSGATNPDDNGMSYGVGAGIAFR